MYSTLVHLKSNLMINFKKIIQKINQKAFLRSIKMMLVTIPMSRAFSDFVIQIREAKKFF